MLQNHSKLTKELYLENYLLKKGIIIRDWSEANKENFHALNKMSDDELTEYLKQDSFYIEGAICIWSYGRSVLTLSHYDLIDQLWNYLIQALEKIILKKEKSAFFMFPDQPLKVEFTQQKRRFTLKIDGGKEYVLSAESITYFLEEGRQFFTRLAAASSTHNSDYEIETINSMLENIKR